MNRQEQIEFLKAFLQAWGLAQDEAPLKTMLKLFCQSNDLQHKPADELLHEILSASESKPWSPEQIASDILDVKFISAEEFKARIVKGLKEYRLQGNYFSPDEIRALTDQAFEEGLHSEN